MLLCDIGNTSFHFLNKENTYKKSVKEFDPQTLKEEVFYICVNPQVKPLLERLVNWRDLSAYIDYSQYYPSMGIDRIIACESIEDGIVIDAGSAITVDIVKEGVFSGGYIYPGTEAMQKCYQNISSALEYPFHYELDLDIMPKNSQDAITYGYLKPLQCEVNSHQMQIYLTGGDAKKMAKIFPDASLDEALLFHGMKKIIQRAHLC
jgi:type III pantothenate kinase